MDKDDEIEELNLQSKRYAEKLNKVLDEVKKVIVGQEEVLNRLILSLIADGHVLLEGVPGLAKTLMIKTLAETINASFCRIQFTPDLLPADIIGTKIYDHRKGIFYTEKGPIFHNFVLADEINRAPPKVQSALLEAMQERQVSIHGDTLKLERPFLVLATQNPIETEGTYKLPEAQVDRFIFKLLINYPNKDEEKIIIRRNTQDVDIEVGNVIDSREILKIQKFNQRIYADEKIEDYVTSIVDATRHPERYDLDLNGMIEYGASPRASIFLVLTGKAHALLNGRGYVIPEDIKAVAHDVLRHRIILTYEAEAEDITPDIIIDRILSRIRPP
ncbi:MAG: ATPase [Candidatus Altiarchaeales archaeon]|nr:MAG: ATPase [Candidatus Altiarchaeales archaeon]HDO82240.1 MoxR family ATPase [Candidatus Altiarchaeales archaeon]HEX54889.1 MoxR family ATPase [Candidatus Altiarchaeales archaeon]